MLRTFWQQQFPMAAAPFDESVPAAIMGAPELTRWRFV